MVAEQNQGYKLLKSKMRERTANLNGRRISIKVNSFD